ncbi:hypothetical protein [Furfurilactobacillus entadae]|uniref:hypothetical protein n=1 Tax=Furfurilactobacillus entadae TaxID=2922307 RepID=UPI0035EDCF66
MPIQTKMEPESKSKVANIWQYLNYKALVGPKHYLALQHEYGYAELLTIRGQDLDSLSNQERIKKLNEFADFEGSNLEDQQIIFTKFPTDTLSQQGYWGRLYARLLNEFDATTDPRRRRSLKRRQMMVMDAINTEKTIADQLFNLEFVLVIFSKRLSELDSLVSRAKQTGGETVILDDMTVAEKERLCHTMHNLNTEL